MFGQPAFSLPQSNFPELGTRQKTKAPTHKAQPNPSPSSPLLPNHPHPLLHLSPFLFPSRPTSPVRSPHLPNPPRSRRFSLLVPLPVHAPAPALQPRKPPTPCPPSPFFPSSLSSSPRFPFPVLVLVLVFVFPTGGRGLSTSRSIPDNPQKLFSINHVKACTIPLSSEKLHLALPHPHSIKGKDVPIAGHLHPHYQRLPSPPPSLPRPSSRLGPMPLAGGVRDIEELEHVRSVGVKRWCGCGCPGGATTTTRRRRRKRKKTVPTGGIPPPDNVRSRPEPWALYRIPLKGMLMGVHRRWRNCARASVRYNSPFLHLVNSIPDRERD